MIQSETCSIRDAIKYYSSSITSTSTLSGFTIPSNFKVIFKTSANSNPADNAWVEVGSDTNNLILFGLTSGRTDKAGVYVKVNGSYASSQEFANAWNANEEHEVTYTYENGTHTFSDETQSFTLSNSSITARTYVRAYINQGTSIKDLTFLPL